MRCCWEAFGQTILWQPCYEYWQHWTFTQSQVVTFSLAQKPVNSISLDSPHLWEREEVDRPDALSGLAAKYNDIAWITLWILTPMGNENTWTDGRSSYCVHGRPNPASTALATDRLIIWWVGVASSGKILFLSMMEDRQVPLADSSFIKNIIHAS